MRNIVSAGRETQAEETVSAKALWLKQCGFVQSKGAIVVEAQ